MIVRYEINERETERERKREEEREKEICQLQYKYIPEQLSHGVVS